jgi:formylglycine-generating enzyme required for sulfatase activity
MICSDKPNLSQAVKILDFGLAKIKSGELLGSFIQAQTTGLMGSPYYMAPEQWADDEPDSRSDIYSLGVMLFQMLAGDVPFKGSSIPAIMKKHISDPAPTFASMGTTVTPEVEAAVMHTLQKEKDKRTPSVEVMISELREAIYPQALGIHTTSGGGAHPVTTINIRTNPPHSTVFVDNIAVGQSRDDGWITLNGIQTGNHRLRVAKDGFSDWQTEVACDGRPQQMYADLTGENAAAATVMYSGGISPNTPQNMSMTGDHASEVQKTMVQNWDTGQHIGVVSQPPKKSFFSPLVIAGIAVFVLGGVGILGVGGAYMAGAFGGAKNTANNSSVNTTNSPVPTDTRPPTSTKAELVAIPAGTFTMGRNDGNENEKPEHEVNVAAFRMDKTEVTNAEFFEFMKGSNYKPANGDKFLAHWVNGKPIGGEENMPVRFVNIEDIKAFAAWRSKRDNTTYRLPTEQEWEYAARNGSKKNLYPWGDNYDAKCAYMDQSNNEPVAVGTKSCADDWGVQDLIGNVFEWTGTTASLYPGSAGEIKPTSEPHYMLRGGSAFQKSTGQNAITSTFRIAVPGSRRSAELGFRLVRAE